MFGSAVCSARIDFGLPKSILIKFCVFDFSCSESIFISRIDSRISENFLLYIRITFRGTTKYESLYLKINSNQINSNKINFI